MYLCKILYKFNYCKLSADSKNSLWVLHSSRREQFVQWVEGLSATQTPSWLGLPNNAEKVLLTNKGDLLFRQYCCAVVYGV